MRVPGIIIYRAFEELDRFGDAECKRFLASALRPWWQRVLRLVACAGLGAIVFVVAFMLMAWNVELAGRGLWGSLLFLAVPGVPSVLGVFTAAIARDIVLRRRLRQVINTRGSCFACGYSLLGLPLSDSSTVACPECGVVTEVDPAMGELASGANGSAANVRTVREVPGMRKQPFWSPQLVRKVLLYGRRGGIAMALLAAAVVLWGVWWFDAANRDAKKALLMLDPAGAMERQSAGLQPAHVGPSTPNLDDVVDSITAELVAQQTEFATEFAAKAREIASSVPVYVDFTVLGHRIAGKSDNSATANMQQQKYEFDVMLAQEAMKRLSGTGIFARLDALAAIERYQPKPSGRIGYAELARLYGEFWKLRTILSVCQGRMATAMAAGDTEAMIRAFESGLVVARLARRGMTGQVVSAELAMLDAVIPMLPRLDDGALKRVEAIVRRTEGVAPLSAMVETERVVAEQQLYEIFRQADSTSWGAAGVAPLLGNPVTLRSWWSTPRLGGLDENLDELKQASAAFVACAAVLPVHRAALENQLAERSQFFVLQGYPLWRNYKLVLTVNDRLMLMRDGVAAMAAIERFKRANGEYPESLEQLVTGFLEAVPVDPWSGKALRYRRLATPDVLGFGFILYSVGSNGTDDGGVHAGLRAFRGVPPLGMKALPQGDFVISASSLGEQSEWQWW